MTREERITAIALTTVLVALLLVGLVSGTILRHVVQVGPLLAAVLAVTLRPGWSRFAAMPVFAFWLFIMALIWLYLLGLARVVTGQFSAISWGRAPSGSFVSALGSASGARGDRSWRSSGSGWWRWGPESGLSTMPRRASWSSSRGTWPLRSASPFVRGARREVAKRRLARTATEIERLDDVTC